MKYWTLIFTLAVGLMLAVPVSAEEDSEKTRTEEYAEKLKVREETFFAAQKAGKTVKGVFVEGNSLFNGTTSPQSKPFGDNYSEEEMEDAQKSAERNSKIFLLTEDGTLYYPTCKKGQRVSMSDQAHRIPRVLTEEQKKQKLFTWATQVPMVGRVVEVYGEVYPGYAGVKGIHIESICFADDYLVGIDDKELKKRRKEK